MQIEVKFQGKVYEVDLNSGIDISIPLDSDSPGPNCFYAPFFQVSPVMQGNFIGDTRKGSPVNFYNVQINPHGNGTHTECVGHISQERVSIHNVLKKHHFIARLISLYPTLSENGDRVIFKEQLEDLKINETEALIVRTMPNLQEKKKRMYSDTNPPYIDSKAMHYIRQSGVKHFITDLPSVDRESDEGKLSGHKAFWNYPEVLDTERTISELVFIDDMIKDGLYFINIQLPSFVLDAAPSRIVLYNLK